MSIGTGIVIAALIIVTVWQIDKHAGWRRLGAALLVPIRIFRRGIAKVGTIISPYLRAIVAILALGLVAGLALAWQAQREKIARVEAWRLEKQVEMQELRQLEQAADQERAAAKAQAMTLAKVQAQAEARAILAKEFRSYGGFTLGDLRREVRFKHGRAGSDGGLGASWARYKVDDNSGDSLEITLRLGFDSSEHLRSISCPSFSQDSSRYYSVRCPAIAGLALVNREDGGTPILSYIDQSKVPAEGIPALLATLGEPSIQSEINADGVQRWCYGLPTSWVCFLRRADIVEGIEVGDREDYGSKSEYEYR